MEENQQKKPTIICSSFVEKDGKFLVILCPKLRLWRVPGGRLEVGEKVEDCVIREIAEELSVTIKDPLFLGFGQDFHFNHALDRKSNRFILYFHAKITDDIVPDPEEIADHMWVNFEEIKVMEDKEEALDDLFQRNPGLEL
ncbi:NUDIX hydrolase [Nanoarchaeota archaeon]